MPERVGSFLSTFNIPQSLAKFVQGLWSVDHKRFDVSSCYVRRIELVSEGSGSHHLDINRKSMFSYHNVDHLMKLNC